MKLNAIVNSSSAMRILFSQGGTGAPVKQAAAAMEDTIGAVLCAVLIGTICKRC
jgi:hypothetical protein